MKLDVWFEFGSSYSYLASARVELVCKAASVDVSWQPFLLGPIFKDQGWNDSPFNLFPAKGRYMWRDMERLCAAHGLPFKKPSVFPRNGLLAARAACVGLDADWLPHFVRAVLAANFGHDRDISDEEVLKDILFASGADPDAILEAAQQPDAKKTLRDQTQRARELGIFGAPSFVSRGEIFWGNDRLGDALAWLMANGEDDPR